MQNTKRIVPWWIKLGIKVVIPLIPIPKELLFRTGIFKHGEMKDPNYALEVFFLHYEAAKPYLPDEFSVLEIGPGDSLATSIISTAHGASKVYLVDVASFAHKDVGYYNALSGMLDSSKVPKQFSSFNEILEAANCSYWINGLESLRKIPSNSIDFAFSHSVFEHIYLNEFEATIGELFRLLKQNGITSHSIDLKDHLAYSLNSLRFSQQIWESKLFRNGSFYTNRLRVDEIIEIFDRAGFEVLARTDHKWEQLPLAKHKLHPDYQKLSVEVLRTQRLVITLRKP